MIKIIEAMAMAIFFKGKIVHHGGTKCWIDGRQYPRKHLALAKAVAREMRKERAALRTSSSRTPIESSEP